MGRATANQIEGLKNFIQDAVEAADNTAARTHQAIADVVSALEQAQESLNSGFQHGIIAVTRINSAIAGQLIDLLERQGNSQAWQSTREHPKPGTRRGR